MTTPVLIVGLGNPGDEYVRTRHNIGFRIIDALVALDESPLRSKRDASLTELTHDGVRVYAMKPHTFMNASGDAVGSFVRYYKIPPERIVVVHDDIDLAFGKIKTVIGRGDAGHQGVASIIESLGTNAFRRIRIGVGSNRASGIPSEEYVLREFTGEEEQRLADKTIPEALKKLAALEHELLKSG